MSGQNTFYWKVSDDELRQVLRDAYNRGIEEAGMRSDFNDLDLQAADQIMVCMEKESA